MKKKLCTSSIDELQSVRREILRQADRVADSVRELFAHNPPLEAMRQLKFKRVVEDTVFDEDMNFVEYLNQTYTYLVCAFAGIELLKMHPGKTFEIHFGTVPGCDLASVDGDIICECFAATTAKSNDKLKKDMMKLAKNIEAKEKYVFFYTDAEDGDQKLIANLSAAYPDIRLCRIPIAGLTTL